MIHRCDAAKPVWLRTVIQLGLSTGSTVESDGVVARGRNLVMIWTLVARSTMNVSRKMINVSELLWHRNIDFFVLPEVAIIHSIS
ncbi:UNVERIFIED_CONTAM: hypothetical protein Slati_3644300 [Sesamum latifolium]|uniref:Secreted protein n=1 Tax=Sesamum latifolium TaxID=2727402 RepID=A0AAW2U4I1_9LAMI